MIEYVMKMPEITSPMLGLYMVSALLAVGSGAVLAALFIVLAVSAVRDSGFWADGDVRPLRKSA